MSTLTKCEPRMVAVCEETELKAAQERGECPTWEVCLPFGGQLVSQGGCVNYTPGSPPPDGVYSKITIANGCIVSAELADIPLYTSSPCAPVPTPCDCTGESSLPDPSTTVGNLFRYDASGRPLVKLSVESGDGISVSGTGTSDNPLVITNTQDVADVQYFRSGNSAITLSGTGTATDPYTFTHITRLSGKQGNFTFDNYGHLIAYETPSTATNITGILEGDGIKVSVDVSTGIATVSLADPTTLVTGVYSLGGYDVEFYRNRVVRIDRVISGVAGSRDIRAADGGTYTLEYDDYGSLANVAYTSAPSQDPTLTTTSATKRFTVVGENTREMTLTTQSSSSFRVSYKENSMPTDILLFINGTAIDGFKFPTATPYMYEAVPIALYSAATHTILLQSETGFTGVGILDVVLTTVQ